MHHEEPVDFEVFPFHSTLQFISKRRFLAALYGCG